MAGRIIAFIARMHIVPFFPEYMRLYDLNYAEAGVMLSVYFIAYGLALVPIGMAADRLSARRLFAWGWIVTGAGIAGVALAPSYAWILVFRVMSGIGVAMLYPPSLKLVSLTFSRQQRGKAIGLLEIGVGIGNLVSMTLYPLLAVWIAFTTLFLAAAVLCLPAGLLSFSLRDPERVAGTTTATAAKPKAAGQEPTSEYQAPPRNRRGLWAERRLWAFLGSTLVLYFVMNGMLAWIPTYLEQIGFDKSGAGLVMGIINTGQVLSSLPAGGISDRIGRRTPVIHAGAVLLGAAPLGFLLAGTGQLPGLALTLLAVLTGVGMGLGIAPSTTLAAELYGTQRSGTVTSANAAVGQLGSALSGALFGWIIDVTQSFVSIWVLCLAGLALRLLLIELVGEPRARVANRQAQV